MLSDVSPILKSREKNRIMRIEIKRNFFQEQIT